MDVWTSWLLGLARWLGFLPCAKGSSTEKEEDGWIGRMGWENVGEVWVLGLVGDGALVHPVSIQVCIKYKLRAFFFLRFGVFCFAVVSS